MLITYSKYFILIIACSLTCSNVSIAQESFLDGFIVTKQNDTIQGFIKEQFSLQEYNILFKPFSSSEEVVYQPNQISEYFLSNNQLFESQFINLKGIKTEVFLKCLIRGEVNLYSFFDKNLAYHFYIETKENGIRELKYIESKMFDEDTGKEYLHKKKEYVGELTFALKDCKNIANQINNVSLKEAALARLIKQYHNCKNEEFIEFVKQKSKSKLEIEFGVLVGANLRFEEFDRTKNTRWGRNINPFIKFYLPNSRKRYSAEFRYNWSTTGVGNRIVDTQSIQLRVNQHFKRTENSIYPKIGVDFNLMNYNGNGAVFGLGYDIKISKLKLITNIEYRFFHSRIFNLNIGLSL